MLNPTFISSSLVALALCIASQAAADVAPPATYVEECTVEKKLTTTTECIECQDSHHPDYANRCTALLTPFCYAKKCDAWGGTAYKQVWCRATNSGNPALPASVNSQLTGYEAANLQNVAGAASCPDVSIPSGTGGTTSTTTPSEPAGTGGTTSVPQATNPSNSGDDGCSLPRPANRSGTTAFGLLGLLGLMLIAKRRKL